MSNKEKAQTCRQKKSNTTQTATKKRHKRADGPKIFSEQGSWLLSSHCGTFGSSLVLKMDISGFIFTHTKACTAHI